MVSYPLPEYIWNVLRKSWLMWWELSCNLQHYWDNKDMILHLMRRKLYFLEKNDRYRNMMRKMWSEFILHYFLEKVKYSVFVVWTFLVDYNTAILHQPHSQAVSCKALCGYSVKSVCEGPVICECCSWSVSSSKFWVDTADMLQQLQQCEVTQQQ